MAPLVSVIMPVRNGEAYIAEALDSALGQSFTDLEILVVDDASTDATGALLEHYGGRVRCMRNESSRGPAHARNRALQHAQGRWVAFLDADDRWLPRKLERQVDFALAHPEFGIVTTDVRGFGAHGVLSPSLKLRYRIRNGLVLGRLLFDNWITTSAAMVPLQYLREVGGFDETPCRLGEDWMLWMQIAARHPVYFLDEVLTERREHSASLGHSDPEATFEDLLHHLERLQASLPQLGRGRIQRAAARICRNRAWSSLQHLQPAAARAQLRRGRSYAPWDARLWALTAIAALPGSWLRLLKERMRRARRAIAGASNARSQPPPPGSG